jgi:hypothetical protein
MGKIGAAIVDQVNYFTLHCENPINFELSYVQNATPIPYHLDGKKVVFEAQLDPSSKVHFKYNCPLLD